ncbi:hypothetical protein, partial [Spiroplasma sp. AdecLV25b]|uniref:hypothetical protein n=1 Tax=Spiroplasma sp. AdecLV25b TaxID=3027162 RepID=UPI0027E031F7
VDKPHWAFNFEQYTPATLLPKKYADDKLQDKTDNVLITTDKTITGAINEVKTINDKQDLHISQIMTKVTNVENVLVLKQDKLTAGDNITIKDNIISATGGKTDLTDYYKKEETNKLLDKKQDKENWVVIGNKIDNRTWSNFDINLGKTYRVFITWHRNAPEQNGYPLMLLFKSAKAVGTGTWTLLIGKIDNKDASLILKADYTKSNKWSLFIKCEIDGGAIFSFEEFKVNTYKITSNTLDITSPSIINIDKPIKINSKSLETNEIEDNCWDIELKDNPTPTPCPCPKWKEVAVTTDLVTINYNLKNNKYYRVLF